MRLTAILTLLVALAFALSPYISEPFTGFDPEQFPEPTPPLILQPAGYAFAIWGVIYLWLVASCLFGAIARAEDVDWQATRWPLIVSMAIGAIWIEVALVAPVWASILIVAMLIAALIALAQAPSRDRWWLAAPIALYAGWLSAASFVAGATVLAGWTGVSPDTASWIGLLCVGILGVAVLRLAPPITYPLALIWALSGVLVKTLGAEADLMIFAGGLAGAMLAIAAAAWLHRSSIQGAA